MTKVRKKYSLLAALALSMTVSMTACGSDEPADRSETSTQAETPTETPTEEPTDEATETPTEEPTEEPTETDPPEVVMPADNNAEGSTYTFKTPKGWEDSTKEMAQGENSPLEVAYMNLKTNESLNVVVIEGQLTGLDDPATKDSIKTELEGAGFKNVQFPGDAELDGEQALRTISEMKIGAKQFYSYQIFTIRDGMNYVVTVGGFDLKTVENNVDVVLDSWTWKTA